MKDKIRKTFLYKLWIKLLTHFGDIYFATEPPKIHAKEIKDALSIIQPGDVICRKYIYYLDSYFIKGKYSHSGIVIDSNQMIHSVAEGVGYIDIMDFIKDCDGFIILRPEYKDEQCKEVTCQTAIEQIGKQYDFLFESQEKATFYCHELTAYCLWAAGIPVITNENIIYAKDIINACEVLYETE